MKNMIKPGKTGMGAINLQVRSSAEIPEELPATLEVHLLLLFMLFILAVIFHVFFFTFRISLTIVSCLY
jgi:hypothetical protein